MSRRPKGKGSRRKPTKCLHREEELRWNELEGAGGVFEGYAIRSDEARDMELVTTTSPLTIFLGEREG